MSYSGVSDTVIMPFFPINVNIGESPWKLYFYTPTPPPPRFPFSLIIIIEM